MEAFLPYLFKSGICLILFYICMRAFLSNETFFRFNRWALIIGSTICLLLPFIRLDIESPTVLQKPFVVVEDIFIPSKNRISNIHENTFVSGETNEFLEQNDAEAPVHIGFILMIVYFAGLTINIIILFRSVYLMLKLIRQGDKMRYGEYILVLVQKDITPFSWGKYIVLSAADFKNYPDEIITHEAAHVRYWHSLDLVYFELLLLFQWFNPAIWLLKRELKDIHEYQADMSVLQSGINATKYQLLLVKKAVGASSYTLANSFNHSKIKKRITMMLKEKSNKWARLKLLLLLPLGTLTVFAFARPDVNEPLSSLVKYESTDNLSDVEISEMEVVMSVPIIKDDTIPKRTVRFTPPKVKPNVPPSTKTKENKNGDPKQVKFSPPMIKKESPSFKNNDVKTKQQRDSLSKVVKDYIDNNGFRSEAKIGVPSQGKFKVMAMSYTGDGDVKSTVFPESYSKKADAKEADYLRIYWYVIDGKKYSQNKFMDKCRYDKVFFDRSKIKAEDGQIMEFYGITTDGAKTPTFYMVGHSN